MVIAFISALCGVAAMSYLLFREVVATSFIPMIFAFPGALLVATAHAYAVEEGWPAMTAYGAAALLGLTTGGLMLGITGGMGNALVGAEYAAAVIFIWLSLDLATCRVRGAAAGQST